MRNRFFSPNPLFSISCFVFLTLFFSCSSPQDDIKTHLKNAKKYYAAEEFEKAKIEYQNVTQMDPENDGAFADLGETYVHLNLLLKAAQSFAHAIAINPDNLKAQLRLGQILLLAGETRQARDMVTNIRNEYPENVEAMHLLSSIQIQERNMPLAIKTLEKAIDMAPSDPRTYLFLANLLSDENRLDEAESYYLKVIELDKTLRAPYMGLAALYRKKGQMDKIESLINQWVKIPGDKAQKNYDLARFQEIQGHLKQAEKTYLEASINFPKDTRALMNLGSFYTRQKQNDKALEVFLRALDMDKKNLTIQTSIADVYFLQHRYTEAESAVDAVLTKDKNHVQANFLKGRLYFNKREFPEALKQFEKVIGKSPGYARARYFKARCLLDRGKSDLEGQDLFRVAAGYMNSEAWERNLAKDELLKALKTDPGFINARILLSDIYLGNKETEKADQQIEAILKADPLNLQALVRKGRLKLMEKDLAGAEKIYRSILERHPDYAGGYVSLGLAYQGMGKAKEAMAAFNKALGINPGQMDALNYKVSLYLRQRKVDKALSAIGTQRQQLKQDSPMLAVIDLIEGKVYMAIGKIDIAKPFFEKAIERLPNLTEPYASLARIYEFQQDIPKAVENYEKLIQLSPDSLSAYLNLSRIYKSQGDLNKARKYLKDALAIKGDFAPAANNLAFMLAEANSSLYEALRLAKIALDHDPRNPDYLDTLGWIYYLQGSNDLALRELEDSIEINSENALTHYHLGWVYYEKQKFEQARQHMAKALELDPDFKGADKARELLGE